MTMRDARTTPASHPVDRYTATVSVDLSNTLRPTTGDVPPAAFAESGDVVGILRPLAFRCRSDQIGLARSWSRRRDIARGLFDRTGDDTIQKLQRFVVKQFLLRLTGDQRRQR
jgi:hypothetical protein